MGRHDSAVVARKGSIGGGGSARCCAATHALGVPIRVLQQVLVALQVSTQLLNPLAGVVELSHDAHGVTQRRVTLINFLHLQ